MALKIKKLVTWKKTTTIQQGDNFSKPIQLTQKVEVFVLAPIALTFSVLFSLSRSKPINSQFGCTAKKARTV